MRVKYMSVKDKNYELLRNLPSFSVTGSVKGMKDKYYGKDALLVRSGSYIYDATSQPDLYYYDAK